MSLEKDLAALGKNSKQIEFHLIGNSVQSGTIVKCVLLTHPRYGKYATVVNDSNYGEDICVIWHDGCTYYRSWSYIHSFVAVVDYVEDMRYRNIL